MEISINEVKQKLKGHYIEASFRLFIDPLELESQNNDEIVLRTKNEWSKEIIEKRFISDIQEVIESLAQKTMKINIVVG